MSKFYGQVQGSSATLATRGGSKDITASVQSYDGSVQTRLFYEDEVLMVEVRTCEGSGFNGDRIFIGTFDEFQKKLKGEN